ncbi:MAG TPA: DsrE family protein [Verrucomicrobiales bacterium]|nr:DsrE family protein [Verrucomicrobiales bacterium]
MSNTFCVTLNHCRADGDKATVAFVIATAALGSGKDTLVFLSTDGVWAAVSGEAEKINEGGPFKPLKELIDNFLAAGGRIIACAPCCKKRDIAETSIIEGVEIAGGAVLVEWLANGSPCVGY